MNHADAVSLIAAGVRGSGKRYLGRPRCGERRLYPRARRAATPHVAGIIRPYQADFRRPLELPELDGLLLANSLHFVAAQARVLRQLLSYVRPQGHVLIVEYDVRRVSPWTPYPVPLERFRHLAAATSLRGVRELNRRPSRFGSQDLYAAVALKP